MSVDVHKAAAFRLAKEAAQKAQHAENIARLADRQALDGDALGAQWSKILASNLRLDVEEQVRVVLALRGETTCH